MGILGKAMKKVLERITKKNNPLGPVFFCHRYVSYSNYE
jgi:hypothetical protein